MGESRATKWGLSAVVRMFGGGGGGAFNLLHAINGVTCSNPASDFTLALGTVMLQRSWLYDTLTMVVRLLLYPPTSFT